MFRLRSDTGSLGGAQNKDLVRSAPPPQSSSKIIAIQDVDGVPRVSECRHDRLLTASVLSLLQQDLVVLPESKAMYR